MSRWALTRAGSVVATEVLAAPFFQLKTIPLLHFPAAGKGRRSRLRRYLFYFYKISAVCLGFSGRCWNSDVGYRYLISYEVILFFSSVGVLVALRLLKQIVQKSRVILIAFLWVPLCHYSVGTVCVN